MGACSYCDGVCKSGGDGMLLLLLLCCCCCFVVVVLLLRSLTRSHGLLSCRIV
jgi:hypothetical protein